MYIGRNDAAHRQLFDMAADPLQQHDLSAEEPAVVESMHQWALADAGGELPVNTVPLREIDRSWYRV